ncbi:MAG: hypothetical protein V4494_06265 [Chlamydiota bacterium]
MRRLSLLLPFWPVLFFFIALAIFGKSSGFGVNKISSNFLYHSEWEVAGEEDPSLKEIISQPFHYLNAGFQSFAFVSEDGKYVLKFFKIEELTPTFMGKIFPIKKYKIEDRQRTQRRKNVFAACKMAYEELKEETGLIYVHLNATDHLKKTVQLFDKEQRRYLVDLDKTVFVVQKKAEMVYKHIGHKMKVNDFEGVKEAVQAVVDLVAARSSKGFMDTDMAVRGNYGFIGNQPIHLDFLGLVKVEEPNEKERIKVKMLGSIAKRYPSKFKELKWAESSG